MIEPRGVSRGVSAPAGRCGRGVLAGASSAVEAHPSVAETCGDALGEAGRGGGSLGDAKEAARRAADAARAADARGIAMTALIAARPRDDEEGLGGVALGVRGALGNGDVLGP